MTKLEHLTKLHKEMNAYNKMTPFPVYDTEYVQRVESEINHIRVSKDNYDELPVVACKYCKSLHITMEDDLTDICNKCFSVNELIEFENIDAYNKHLTDSLNGED